MTQTAKSRIAILADIHGNMPALEAVVEDIATQRVDEVLVGGDLVGRGPEGSRVVKRVRALGWPAIGGNHEDYLLTFRRGAIPDDWRTTDEWAAARWMAAELDESDADYIAALPFSLSRPDLQLVHGSPESNRAGIWPWSKDEEITAHLATSTARVLVCAHTHRPLRRAVEAGMVVNVGSVGLPFNGDPRAQYAILSRGGPHGWEVEPRQVPYERERTFARYRATGFLAAGGVTARLLWLELEHAAPLLVPFLEWAKTVGVVPTTAQIDAFFRIYQPGEPLGAFFRRLEEIG